MKQDNYIFPAVFDYADDGISIEFPDLPGCLSCADSDEEAFYNAKEALRSWLLVAEEYGEEIPTPTPLKDVAPLQNQRVVLVDTCLAIFRDAHRNRAIKKTLTIPYWLNEKAENENINFSYVLQIALKEQLRVMENK